MFNQTVVLQLLKIHDYIYTLQRFWDFHIKTHTLYTNMHTHAHTHTYAHTHMHTHTRTHTHKHTHTHTHAYTQRTPGPDLALK